LYLGTKKVAKVFEAGDGGPLQVTWADTKGYGDNSHASPDAAAFKAFAEKHTYTVEWDDEEHKHCPETFIGELVDQYEQARVEKKQAAQVKRWCSKETVVIFKKTPDQYHTFKAAFSERVKKALTAKYTGPNAILEFVNERYT
jgi:hypothetical protein